MLILGNVASVPPAGGATDPLFSNVVLLVNSIGKTDGSTTFTDLSDSAQTLSAESSAQYSNAVTKHGTTSIAFDGTNDSVHISDTSDLDFSDRTVEFCIECWVRINGGASVATLNTFMCGRDSSSAEEWVLRTSGAGYGVIFAIMGSGSTVFSHYANGTFLTDDTWHHIAVTRTLNGTDGDVDMYIDGVAALATGTQTSNGTTNTAGYDIGHNDFRPARDLDGYVDSVRVTRGDPRYTGDFTPAEFPTS